MSRRSSRRGQAQSASVPVASAVPPIPVLLLNRGPLDPHDTTALDAERRIELFRTSELTREWISFAHRVAGVIVATHDDPLSALGYVITAGIHVPTVLAIDARDAADTAQCADLTEVGAASCFALPITPPDLEGMLTLLARSYTSSHIDATVRVLFDPIARTVRYKDRHVNLSQREYAVLYCLSNHEGRPVAATEIMSTVWGDSEAPDRSRQILDVYVFQLRRKLKRIGLGRTIETVRGFGYSFVPKRR